MNFLVKIKVQILGHTLKNIKMNFSCHKDRIPLCLSCFHLSLSNEFTVTYNF